MRDTNNPVLTDEQSREAVELFAQGFTRAEVASHLIDNNVELQHLEKDDNSTRKRISDALRPADPNCSQFSVSKYGEQYKNSRTAVIQSLNKRYDTCVSRSIEFLSNETKKLEEQIEELDYLIENAMEINPTGTSEYLAIINARNNAAKRIAEIQEKMLERIERATGINQE